MFFQKPHSIATATEMPRASEPRKGKPRLTIPQIDPSNDTMGRTSPENTTIQQCLGCTDYSQRGTITTALTQPSFEGSQMDFSKLSQNQQIALGGGALAVISLFLPWYGVLGINFSAWNAGLLAWGGLLLTIAAAAVLVLKALEVRDVKVGNLAAEQFALVLGAVGLVFIVLRWLTDSNFTKFGLFLGLIAAAAVTYASFASMKDAGLELPSADDFKSND